MDVCITIVTKFDLIIEVLNFILLLTLYIPCDSSFIWIQFPVLNSDSGFNLLSNKFFLYIFYYYITLYCYIKLILSIVFYLSSRDIYLSLNISSFICFWIILWWGFWGFCKSFSIFFFKSNCQLLLFFLGWLFLKQIVYHDQDLLTVFTAKYLLISLPMFFLYF